ncbi:site-specific integrase [Solibacillus sp. FSL R5-0691]|uniref:site-specific integrase n=1 Tax=Solibacillus sp. FSL R5-0691 TaxID=2921653 RepID=UPI0030CE8A2D
MASFQKRGQSWQYTVSYKDKDGKHKTLRKSGFKTKTEAKNAATLVETEILEGNIAIVRKQPFHAYFHRWYTTFKKDYSKTTIAAYKATESKIANFFGDKAIHNITRFEYQEFISKLGESLNHGTVSKTHKHIRACVTDALEDDLLKKDFTRKVIVSGIAPKKHEEKFINYSDSQKLLKYLVDNIELGLENYMLILALTTGMRYAEILALQWTDFDFVNGCITVNKQLEYKHQELTTNVLKNVSKFSLYKVSRTITLDKFTLDLFEDLKNNESYIIENHLKIIFYKNEIGKIITNDRINDVLRAILKRLNISPVISFHGLRHTHASILLYQRVSIVYISERLGHNNLDTTIGTYSHLVSELREEDSNKTKSIFKQLFIN